MNHGQTRTHKTHPGLDLGEGTTFPLKVYSMPCHRASIQVALCPRTPKWESRNSQSCDSRDFGGLITFHVDLRWRWGLNQSYSSHRELFNNMWHTTYTQGNWGNSWLLVVGSQTVNLIPSLSFGRNLCFKCPNGWCKPILDIYILKSFPMI